MLEKKRSRLRWMVGRESESRNVPIETLDGWLTFCMKSLFIKIRSSEVNYSWFELTERGCRLGLVIKSRNNGLKFC